MNEQTQKKCELLVQNQDVIADTFHWESNEVILAAASAFTQRGILADGQKLKENADLYKKEFGIFSDFRGNVEIPMICRMASTDAPEEYLKKVKDLYQQLHKNDWLGSEWKVLAAMIICDQKEDPFEKDYVALTNEVYTAMKKEHPWLTSDEDIPFAAMLAASDLDKDALFKEMDKNFALLKEKYGNGNTSQSLSAVMALSPAPAEEKLQKLNDVFDALKEQGHEFGKGPELISLSALCLADLSKDEIVSSIAEADDYLKEQKGFAGLSLSAAKRRMYAAQMVMNIGSDIGTTAGIGAVISAVAEMEELLMMMVIFSTIYIVNND